MRYVVCMCFVKGKTKDDLLQGCRALRAPSFWWKPLGLIAYGAYEFGRPVLAGASGGLKETVIEGKAGFELARKTRHNLLFTREGDSHG